MVRTVARGSKRPALRLLRSTDEGRRCQVFSPLGRKLKFASQRMRDWEADESYEPKSSTGTVAASLAQLAPAPTPTPASVPAPKPMPPLFKPPLLPKAPRHSLPKMTTNPLARMRASLTLDVPSTPRQSTSTSAAPLIPLPATGSATPKVRTYHRSHPVAGPATPAPTSVAPETPSAAPATLIPGALSTPMAGKRVYGMNTRSVGRPQPKFKTPFKAGLAPGEPGRLELERRSAEKMKTASAQVSKPTHVKAHTARPEAKKTKYVAFDLSAFCTPFRGD